jgi:hypothetical protein
MEAAIAGEVNSRSGKAYGRALKVMVQVIGDCPEWVEAV